MTVNTTPALDADVQPAMLDAVTDAITLLNNQGSAMINLFKGLLQTSYIELVKTLSAREVGMPQDRRNCLEAQRDTLRQTLNTYMGGEGDRMAALLGQKGYTEL